MKSFEGYDIQPKPCFCGSEDLDFEYAFACVYVFCNQCSTYGPAVSDDCQAGLHEKAIELWNGWLE